MVKNKYKFNSPESHIHFLTRGFLLSGNKIVLCRQRGKDYFFLPGGHIEDGESAKVALLRELKEELGKGKYKISDFMGICESVFSMGGNKMKHEVNMVFRVILPKRFVVESREGHIEFISIKKEKIGSYNILPKRLKQGIMEWIKNGKVFFK